MTLGTNWTSGLVSVIVPLYNRVTLIEQTIDSVLSQNYADIELIVVDDGSTDGSFELVQKLSEQHPIVLLYHPHRQNHGQSAAINLGLSHAQGEYIAILDSDDLFAEDKVKIQVEALKQHPDYGLVYGLGWTIDEAGKPLYPILDEKHIETNTVGAVLLDCYFLLPQNALVRREVYQQVGGFDESLRAAQDHDMLIRMAEVCKFLFVPQLFFYYRRHANSISVTGLEKRWRAGFVILNKAKKRFDYPKKVIRQRLAVLHFRLGHTLFFDNKSRLAGLTHMAYSGLLDPIRAIKVLLKIEQIR